MPIDGVGRGDGDQGSGINYHIGYLKRTDKFAGEDGKKNIKPYIRTGPLGKRVKPKQKVEFDLRRYFIRRATDEENDALIAAEADLKGWKAKASYYGAYIKIAEIITESVEGQDDLDDLGKN